MCAPLILLCFGMLACRAYRMVVMKGCFTCGKLGVTVAHGVACTE